MYVSIKIERSGNRAFYNAEGTPEDIAKALIDLADSHTGVREALKVVVDKLAGTGVTHKPSVCECGKLSPTECQMRCIAPTVNAFQNPVSFTPQFPARTDDQGNDDGAYADDDPSDD